MAMRSLLQWLRPWALPAASLLGLEWFARTAGRHSDVLAPPSAALQAFAGSLFDGSLREATLFTLGSASLGLLIGSALGLALGLVLGLSRRAAAAGSLSVEMLRPVPSVALIPIAMLLFGFGVSMQVSVVAFATLWPMLVITRGAVKQLEPRLLEVSSALQLSPLRRAWMVVLPAILPRLLVGLRLGVSVALVVAVTVEIAANPNGMGYALMLAQQGLAPALMMSWLGWIGVVGFVVNAAVEHAQRAAARYMGEAS